MKLIYTLSGENKEAILEYKKKIAKKFLGKDYSNNTYIKYNMLETTIEELLFECQSLGFFSEKKVVVANNSIFLQAKNKKSKINYNIDLLINYLKNPNENVVLIFVLEEEIDNRKKIVKEINKIGEAIKFSKFTTKELVDYSISYLLKKEVAISKQNAEFLVFFSQLDFGSLKKELEKLELLNKKNIEKEDIENIVVRGIDYDIFNLVNCLFSKKYLEMFEVYSKFKLKGEEPVYLLSLISSQLRIYYKVKIMLINNFNQKDIAARLSIHPYRVKIAAENISFLSLEKLYNCILLCEEYDKNLKTLNVDKYTTLEIFINKIINNIEK